MLRCIFTFCVIVYFCTTLLAQEKPGEQEPPEKNSGKEQAASTEVQEEERQSLLRRIEARKLIKDLPVQSKKTHALQKLEKLGREAIVEMLSSKNEAAKEALLELCRQWTSLLSGDNYEERERAFGLLYVSGDICIPLLKEATSSKDFHLCEKAKLLLHMIDYRISPALYERLGHVMVEFGNADWRKKTDMISELERLGGPLAVPSLKRILSREENPRVQAHAANSLIRVGTLEDLLFLKKIGLAEKIQAPALTAEIYISQGMKYLEADRFEEAIAEFKRAIKDAPDDIRAHYGIAMAYLQSGKYALSITHFQKCLEQQANNPITHYNLACTYSLMNDADNAIKHLALAIEHGYKDLAHMEKDQDFNNIRTDPRYKQLKEKLEKETNPTDNNSEQNSK